MTDTNMSDATPQGSSETSGQAGMAREAYEQVKSKAKDAMPRITEAARSQAMGQAETAKDALADTGERLAQSLRSAMDGGDESVQAKLMAAAADAVTDMSNSLRGRSFNQLMGEAETFARRNPGAFVAAAALAGFALARFARASSSSGEGSGYRGAYGGGSSDAGMSYGSGGMGGAGYAAGRGMGVSTSGMSTHDDDMDEAGSIADDGMGGGVGTATPNSTSDKSGTGYDR